MSPSDAPAALVMGAGFLAFGVTMMLRPGDFRVNLDRFTDDWKPGSWHPYKMPDWGLRLAGLIGIAGATLFFYIAYVALPQARQPLVKTAHRYKKGIGLFLSRS